MGKRIISQRRGHGSSTYRSPSHRHIGKIKYPRNFTGTGRVIDIIHAPGRSAPVAEVKLENGKRIYLIASEGMYVGQTIAFGKGTDVLAGNVMPLGDVPDGTVVYNIEARPGDGGKFIRSGGNYGVVISHGIRTVVQMPSGQFRSFLPDCLATIGKVAGGGRTEKPFIKAGKKYHSLRSRARKWPRVRGIAMNPVNHPHGGGNHQHIGRPSTVNANAPPGRKVGHISSKKKRRKR